MLTDQQMRAAAQAVIDSSAVPTVPFAAIQDRIASHRRFGDGEASRWRRRRAVAAALALVALPSLAYAVVSDEVRSRAALQAQGGWAPPAAPAAFLLKLKPETVTFAQAQSAATFSLIAPAGLPAGASLNRVEISPTGVYDESAHAWRSGSQNVVFQYWRAGGRTFEITAQRYSEQALPGRYLFEDRGPDVHGNPTLIKHERFASRNGDQMMIATDGGAVEKGEILSIARSMNGSLLALPWPSPHSGGTLRVPGH